MSPPQELRVVEHDSPVAFLARAGEWLARAEAEHGAFFTICGRLGSATPPDSRPHLLTLEEGDEVVAAALQTPPRKWVVSRASAAASGAPVRPGKAQRIWELRAPAAIYTAPGRARLAADTDTGTVVAWARGFALDAATDETPAQ